MAVTTTPASLTVSAGNAPRAILIPAPSDPNYTAAQLVITVTGLPTDGTVYLADEVTPVIAGEELSVAQLTGLTFAAGANAAGQSSQFSYTVSDPAGATGTGAATLSAVANSSGPQTSAASLTTAENAEPTTIGIIAPTDPNHASSSLSVSVLGLPTNGTVTLADGTTTVSVGETLTVAQLAGLKFAPTSGVVAESSQFSYSVSDQAGNSSLGIATLSVAPAPGSTILTVGPGEEYSTVAAAVAASHNGDTIQVQAGTYVNDFATINDNITLEGVGGMVNMVATGTALADGNDKGIFVTNGNDTINNFSFSGAQADPSSANGAGIRYQSGNLTLNYDYFFNNQDGLLGGSGGTGSITINDSEFANNGVSDPSSAGYGETHNVYVGHIATLTIDNSYIYAANVGHEIKSRAENTIIENSNIDDGPTGTASYSIDLPNGGNALIENNVIEQGPQSQNPIIISIGEEGVTNSTSSLQIIGNTILNDLTSGSALAVKNKTSVTARITDNQSYGLSSGQIATGANTQSGNTFLTSEPALSDRQPWAPIGSSEETPCYCRGTLILTDQGEVPVEMLAIGGIVVTRNGSERPIKWIGRRSYTGRFVARNKDVLPIRIHAGALEDGIPSRDLWVSPEHALFIDEALVPARHLVNGLSIVQVEDVESIEYFHVELANHDVIIADGALAETFVDDDSRMMFHNALEYFRLFPTEGWVPALFCAPRIEDGHELEAIRRRLRGRAHRLGANGISAAPSIKGRLDLVRHDLIEGWAFDPAAPRAAVTIVILANGAEIAQLVADRYRRDLEAAGIGNGCHAFSLVVPGGLSPDMPLAVEVYGKADWAPLAGSPFTLEPIGRPNVA